MQPQTVTTYWTAAHCALQAEKGTEETVALHLSKLRLQDILVTGCVAVVIAQRLQCGLQLILHAMYATQSQPASTGA